ncbi:NAD/NADP octopine/nopaline dehydrogenase family protein [Candidatus Symbiopectobacterium sp. NZEC127]|uniref:NAD/NADP-dependent octopine/nopaline dehydrogenase family protein n=1 Tax=Candidatus Symbiopectobacterium sp. NZEC127 TaxID=2820472 RepID=UPI00222717FC|nr:NAD/NADP-dependent octopine/nopaline dehydrogenase family protein [Candidatus Symbiopectobacterium sp. NZEC127]MCW2485289.1 NAD/NADP octopine/nopaline dehydrogenase family protein [Candidatus Symbiopectobacterium sp. NZEC127]
MKIALLGAGNIGFASAAWLCHHGHQTVLWARDAHTLAGISHAHSGLHYTGVIEGECRPAVTTDIAAAVRGADAVLLCVPGYGHRAVMEALAPHLTTGQPVIINSACSLSALFLSQLLAQRAIRAPIITWGTTAFTARRKAENGVTLMTARRCVHVATLPAAHNAEAIALCEQLFGKRFQPQSNILATSLININPIAHLGLALCNVTRIEHQERWPQYHYMTDGVANLILALEQERQALAQAFGLRLHSIEAHFQQSFDVSCRTLSEIAAELHRRRGGPPGPTDMNTRFILEDTPYGLVFAEAIARKAGIALPLHSASITLASAVWQCDLRAQNDVLPSLELDALSLADFTRSLQEGISASQARVW